VSIRIRPLAANDADEIVALSLRAWEPVFDSLKSVLGRRLFAELRGDDWRPGQAAAVRATLEDVTVQTWVAETDGAAWGFASAKHKPDEEIGEILMLAVDPRYQRRGIATELTNTATIWLAEHGASVVMVETGGDAGHAAARATYEHAGFTPLPAVRYFKSV
jgi:ribosomal protein S18 acetylase RimI-like enzyme